MSSTSSTRSDPVRIVAAVCTLAVAGCAGHLPQPALESAAELANVPFFPQTEYDCGPAALATVLVDAGVEVTPADLVGEVYIEGLRGSLQAELLAATRRHGMLPVPIEPAPASLIAELRSGRPVLVLQNLGFERLPVWHYAVVVGVDAAAGRVVLRSGEERRRVERARRFLRSWQRAGNWAFVAAPPGEVPASATPAGFMRALIDAEHVLTPVSVRQGYTAALERWPHDPDVVFLAAVRAHGEGDRAAAAARYRDVLAIEPGHTAARNNLAHVLLEQGCRSAALDEARAALSAIPPGGDFLADVADTVRLIEGSPASSADPEACPAG